MTQANNEEMLSAYIDGELEAGAMREVDLLLEEDEAARKFVIEAVRTSALLRADMNDVLTEEIPARLLETLKPDPKTKSGRHSTIHNLLRVAAVLVLGLIGFGTGMLMDSNIREQFPAAIAPLPARYNNVVEAALENNLSGKPQEWQAPRNAVAVKVTPIKTYRDKNGVYYREYRLEVETGTKRSQINGLAYRTVNGHWKTKAIFFPNGENTI